MNKLKVYFKFYSRVFHSKGEVTIVCEGLQNIDLKSVPRALEQYVVQLAENGPGSCAKSIPKVSSPKILREVTVPEHDLDLRGASDHDTDSEVDIN